MKVKAGKEADWEKCQEMNSDSYGKAVVDFARRWAESMEKVIEESDKHSPSALVEHAERLSREADTEGITGFMYGCAVNVLSQLWEYGEELRKWHNAQYEHEGEGVVNPALLTMTVGDGDE